MKTKMRTAGLLAIVLIFGMSVLSGAPTKKGEKREASIIKEGLKSGKESNVILWQASDKVAKSNIYKKILTLAGHRNTVFTASFSPDGKKVVTGSMDYTAIIWDVNSGTQIATCRPLKGSGGWVKGASFSPDGKKIVMTSGTDKDGTPMAIIYDSSNGDIITILKRHGDQVNSASFSPDGTRVVTASDDNTAIIWDAATGAKIFTLRGHGRGGKYVDAVSSASFSPDGKRVVTAGNDGKAIIWDANSGTQIIALGHTEPVRSASFSPDGTRIVTASFDTVAIIWDANNGSKISTLRGHGYSLSSASFSPDGKRVVTSSADKTAIVWDASKGTKISTIDGYSRSITSAVFSPDSKRIITTSEYDKTAIIWEAPSSTTPFASASKILEQKILEYIKLKSIKEEFESDSEYLARMKILQNSISTKRLELLQVAIGDELGNPELTWVRYNANERKVYLTLSATGTEYNKQISFQASPDEAKRIKENIPKVSPKAYFSLNGQSISLEKIDLVFDSKTYIAKADGSIKTESAVMYAFSPDMLKPINLTDTTKSVSSTPNTPQPKHSFVNDDLAPLLLSAKQKPTSSKKWLFAVAVENYDEADKVIFAKKSADVFVAAAQKRFGIDDRHTYAFIDEKATTTALTDKLDRFIRNLNDGDTVYFYYSGHGIPSPDDGEAYFLPKDKVVDYVTKEKELMAAKIYEKLGKSKAGSVIAFVDACFSGKTDNVSNIKGAAAGVFKAKKVEFDKSKMVVISAGSSKQFSNSYDDKEHRLFTYFLTKNILESDNLDLDLLYKKTATQVKEISWKKGDTYLQEPQIEGNSRLKL